MSLVNKTDPRLPLPPPVEVPPDASSESWFAVFRHGEGRFDDVELSFPGGTTAERIRASAERRNPGAEVVAVYPAGAESGRWVVLLAEIFDLPVTVVATMALASPAPREVALAEAKRLLRAHHHHVVYPAA